MRLLNSRTGKLIDFSENTLPPYAIFSHTWGQGEVTFQQLTTKQETLASQSGRMKIRYACEQASIDGIEWVWIDT